MIVFFDEVQKQLSTHNFRIENPKLQCVLRKGNKLRETRNWAVLNVLLFLSINFTHYFPFICIERNFSFETCPQIVGVEKTLFQSVIDNSDILKAVVRLKKIQVFSL